MNLYRISLRVSNTVMPLKLLSCDVINGELHLECEPGESGTHNHEDFMIISCKDYGELEEIHVKYEAITSGIADILEKN